MWDVPCPKTVEHACAVTQTHCFTVKHIFIEITIFQTFFWLPCHKNVKCLFIVGMHLATPSMFTDIPLKLKETNISNKHNRLKNPNWQEADQLAIDKHGRGVELGSTEKQLQPSGQSRTSTHDLGISSPAP